MMHSFLNKWSCPLVILGEIQPDQRERVAQFLLRLQAPIIAEALSGLREDPRLEPLIVIDPPKEVDAILRIGNVPTAKIWRDLEVSSLASLSISSLPFSGAGTGELVVANPGEYLAAIDCLAVSPWERSQEKFMLQEALFAQYPRSEQALIRDLSDYIPRKSHIYLGNSLPIRHWDAFATRQCKEFDIRASRGLNGIDGQLATFFGLCRPDADNWAIIGDLTALYDLSAYWILPQMEEISINVVIINNGGGKIFENKFKEKSFQCNHCLSFEPLAKLWNLSYEKWEEIPCLHFPSNHRLVELVADERQTADFNLNYMMTQPCSSISSSRF